MKHPKAYLVELSNKRTIKIDADEVEKVIQGVSRGAVVKLRQGVLNPSFFVDIVIDDERMREYRSAVRAAETHNDQDRRYGKGDDQRKIPELRSLADIFADMEILPAGSNIKHLENKK